MNFDPTDPDVRRAVLEAITFEDALAIMRTRLGKVWNQAAAEIIIEGLKPLDDPGEALTYVKALNRKEA